MFERPHSGERAIAVHISFPDYPASEHLPELIALAKSAGADVVTTVTGQRQVPDAKYYLGQGKAEEIKQAVELHQVEVIIFNHDLSPSQTRNLEEYCQCRVLDRTGLILDIFAQRARTHEGKLQVELAQLDYMATRLVRGWTHLERQKGGIGLRGPGETQLETDRRLLRERIKTIKKRLAKVRAQRAQNRQARRRDAMPVVALVGYTNAGKSSVFNALVGFKAVVAENKLFATLDPTLRKIELPGAAPAILADTVGFIRHLPHKLIDAFQATLEETVDADLLLHVIDSADPHWRVNSAAVAEVIAEIGADQIPQILVFNKIDKLTTPLSEPSDKRVWVSAKTGQGIDQLQTTIATQLYGEPLFRQVILAPHEGKLHAQLYQLGAIVQERCDEQGNWHLALKIASQDFERLFQ